jgi:hypothetical protein
MTPYISVVPQDGLIAALGKVLGQKAVNQIKIQLVLQNRYVLSPPPSSSATSLPAVPAERCARVEYRLRARQAIFATLTVTQEVSRWTQSKTGGGLEQGPFQAESDSSGWARYDGPFWSVGEVGPDGALAAPDTLFKLPTDFDSENHGSWRDLGNPVFLTYNNSTGKVDDADGTLAYIPPYPVIGHRVTGAATR